MPDHKVPQPLEPRVGLGYLFRFDEGPFGSGLRLLIVAKVGRKWLTLLHPTTLETARLPLSEFGACKARLPGPTMTNYTSAKITAETIKRYLDTPQGQSFVQAEQRVKGLLKDIEKEGEKDGD